MTTQTKFTLKSKQKYTFEEGNITFNLYNASMKDKYIKIEIYDNKKEVKQDGKVK